MEQPMQDRTPRSRPQSYHSQNDLILVIDLGSSSVRASAYMTNGERLEDASVSRGAEQATDGTFDPHTLTELTEQVVGNCLERVRSMGGDFRFIAVAWTSFAMSWLGADRSGQPITPVYSYADTRSGSHADLLRENLRRKGHSPALSQRTGTPIHTAYAPAQLLRLAAEEPERLAPPLQVSSWRTLASHLLARWFGGAPGADQQQRSRLDGAAKPFHFFMG